jgi:hypothetical protein
LEIQESLFEAFSWSRFCLIQIQEVFGIRDLHSSNACSQVSGG